MSFMINLQTMVVNKMAYWSYMGIILIKNPKKSMVTTESQKKYFKKLTKLLLKSSTTSLGFIVSQVMEKLYKL